jgi:DNA invertase Pin-like site-specific DNA recombinase
MQFGHTPITNLLARGGEDRATAVRMILAAYAKHGSVAGTARELHMNLRTLWRWVSDTPELRAAMVPSRG